MTIPESASAEEKFEVLETIDIHGDGKLVKEILVQPAEGAQRPKAGETVFIHFTGYLKDTGKKFDSTRDRDTPFDFKIGTGTNVVIPAWEEGVMTMAVGERARLIADSSKGYGTKVPGNYVPANADLIFDVELLSIKEAEILPPPMTQQEKYELMSKNKEEGNAAFKKGDYTEAAEKYQIAMEIRKHTGDSDTEMEDVDNEKMKDAEHEDHTCTAPSDKAWEDMKTICELNYANLCLKTKNYKEAIVFCGKVLEKKEESTNTKALFRRGCARLALGLPEEAKADFISGAKAEPANKDFRVKVEECNARIQEAKMKAKSTFGGMFEKMHIYDEKQDFLGPVEHNIDALPKVYLDIKVGSAEPERMTFALYSDSVPRTAENFRALCTGEKGKTTQTDYYPEDTELCFKGSKFHRIIEGFMMQGGDFTNGDGTGGLSVYGSKFADENFRDSHTKKGLLSMANSGPGTNGSQFFVTFKETPHLDGKHVVFGEVIDGLELLDKIEQVETGDKDVPEEDVIIVDCGQLKA